MGNFQLPHWAQLALGLAVVVITWVVQQTQTGALVLPAAAISGLTLALTILGILTPSASTAANKRAVSEEIANKTILPPPTMRGFARIRILFVLTVVAGIGLSALLASNLTGCVGGVPTPTTVTGITAGVNFAVCVLGQSSQCEAAQTPWPQCLVGIVQACGGDAANVAKVVDAHNAALARARALEGGK